MKIDVHFFGDTKRFLPADASGRRVTVEIPAGSNVDALCEHLGMAEEAVVIMVNDVQHHRGTVLDDGDAVTFLPSLVGGEARLPSHTRSVCLISTPHTAS